MTFPTAGDQVYYNEDGEVLGWDRVTPDYEYEIDDWEGGMDQNDPADDPNHSHYTDMDFDTDALNITGNVNKECSFCGEPVFGPWDESYYEAPEDASIDPGPRWFTHI